ncbi:MAG: hypothetical protein FJ386_04685 [Verrucomicrobia bacterium]|nr:hypothetical protein [Verrucomicrobiota bacterium]
MASISRRRAAGLSAGALLSLGLWPGRLRAADNGKGGEFTFIVVNDLHYLDKKCEPWFAAMVRQMKATEPRPEFALVVGDLCEHGTPGQLGPVRDVLNSIGISYNTVIGNHDWTAPGDRKAYDKFFPDSTNYNLSHRGWQFIGLDSSDGPKASGVSVQAHTLRWLDDALPRIKKDLPTVVFTHFPFGVLTPYRVVNADAVLERFKELNLVAMFNGHFHGFTERPHGGTMITTNRCCAFSRANHDRTKEKGYFLCRAKDGKIARQFVEVKLA